MLSLIALALHLASGTTPVAIDGDTIRVGKERIRLLGIDAPEMPGHCRRGRACVPGDPHAAKVALQRLLAGRLKVQRYGRDFYGRTLATVTAGGTDVACRQIATGHARYLPAYDRRQLVARRCGLLTD